MKGTFIVGGFIGILAALASPQPASAKQVPCPGFGEGNVASPMDVDRFYARRAVTIVRAGLAGDTAAVGALVSPHAWFATWQGDYTAGGRQSGVAAALEWVRGLGPVRFESVIDETRSFSLVALKCEYSVTVLFRTLPASSGVNVTFKFVDGMLVQAAGREVSLLESDVGKAP